jgi:hypothetical protein
MDIPTKGEVIDMMFEDIYFLIQYIWQSLPIKNFMPRLRPNIKI